MPRITDHDGEASRRRYYNPVISPLNSHPVYVDE